MLHVPGLYIGESEGKGRGVFTALDLNSGDVIEVCPVIIIPNKQVEAIHKTILHDFYFLWPNELKDACLALGYGSIYNHSSKPNAEVAYDIPNNGLEIRCLVDIASGDEIVIDYTGGTKETDLWFKEE